MSKLSAFIEKNRKRILLFPSFVLCIGILMVISQQTQTAAFSNIEKEQGYSWIAPIQDLSPWQRLFFIMPQGIEGSTLTLEENGHELPKSNTLHEIIRRNGAGTFSHWGDKIYFSTLENDDPRTNGKTYSYRVKLQVRYRVYAVAFLFTLGICVLFVICFFSTIKPRLNSIFKRRSIFLFFAILLCVSVGLLIVRPTYTGVLTNIQKAQENCWIAPIQKLSGSQSLFYKLPIGADGSQLVLKEDGQKLPISNALHEIIRRDGAGTYSHWGDQIWFSTLENDDPRTNGKIYSYSIKLQVRHRVYIAIFLSILCLCIIFATSFPGTKLKSQKAIMSFVGIALCAGIILSVLRPTQEAVLSNIQKGEGKLWAANMQELSLGQSLFFDIPWGGPNSLLILKEDSLQLRPSNSHEYIRQYTGIYSHWGKSIFFSTSQNDNPTINGKKYIYSIVLETKTWVYSVTAILMVVFALFFIRSPKNQYNSKAVQYRPLLVSGLLLKMLMGAIVFVYSAYSFSASLSKWEIDADTDSYFNASFADPWNSFRPPAYRYYVEALGQYDTISSVLVEKHGYTAEQFNKIVATEEIPNNAFLFVSRANYLLMVIGLAVLAVALSYHINLFVAALAVIVSLSLSPLSPPFHIGPEPLVTILLLYAVSSGLFFLYTQRLFFLISLAIFSSYAFLVKPGFLFLPFVAGMLVLVVFIDAWRKKNNIRTKRVFIIGCFLFWGIVFWPWRLYMTSGELFVSQAGTQAEMMFAMALLQPGDEKLFPEGFEQQFVSKMLKKKPEVDKMIDEQAFPGGRSNYSLAYIYIMSVNTHTAKLFGPSYYLVYGQGALAPSFLLTQLRCHKIAKMIIKAHHLEYYKIVGRSILSVMGFYPDYISSPVLYTIVHSGVPFYLLSYIFISSLIMIALAIVIGDTSLRWPILFIASIHPLAVVAMCFGHGVLTRYLQPQEWTLILAFILAIYSLLKRYAFPWYASRKMPVAA